MTTNKVLPDEFLFTTTF